jgi:hypothetical protein
MPDKLLNVTQTAADLTDVSCGQGPREVASGAVDRLDFGGCRPLSDGLVPLSDAPHQLRLKLGDKARLCWT